jgi:hypothetical protein
MVMRLMLLQHLLSIKYSIKYCRLWREPFSGGPAAFARLGVAARPVLNFGRGMLRRLNEVASFITEKVD